MRLDSIRTPDDLRDLGTEEIYFAGGGEPLVHPRAWDALREALHRGFTASLHTNFSLVDDDGVDRLIRLGVHHVTVSLWAGTREAYAATHPGTDPETFDQVTQRLRDLNRRRIDRPRTKLYHVLTRENADDVAAMVDLAADLGCDAVEWAVADVIPGHTDAFGIAPDQASAVLDVLRPLASRAPWRSPRPLGIETTITRLEALAAGRPADSALVHEQPCFAGWNYARVMADGRVIPCLKAHRVPSGNIHDEPFSAIWSGARQAAFRRAARRVRKEGPFFASIGNDPNAACGCELGCDNHAENRRAGDRLQGLTSIERTVLRGASVSPDRFAARWSGRGS
jgi:radical SAM protein with 4Fe4S-binding SPASM domain